MLSAIVGVIGFVLSNTPKLSVDVSGSLVPANPMSTVFYLSNDGLLPIHDITATCGIESVGTPQNMMVEGFRVKLLPESLASILSPGHKMTLPCAHVVGFQNPPAEIVANITIYVDYRPDFVWWHKQMEFPMRAKRTASGNYLWKHIPR